MGTAATPRSPDHSVRSSGAHCARATQLRAHLGLEGVELTAAGLPSPAGACAVLSEHHVVGGRTADVGGRTADVGGRGHSWPWTTSLLLVDVPTIDCGRIHPRRWTCTSQGTGAWLRSDRRSSSAEAGFPAADQRTGDGGQDEEQGHTEVHPDRYRRRTGHRTGSTAQLG